MSGGRAALFLSNIFIVGRMKRRVKRRMRGVGRKDVRMRRRSASVLSLTSSNWMQLVDLI